MGSPDPARLDYRRVCLRCVLCVNRFCRKVNKIAGNDVPDEKSIV